MVVMVVWSCGRGGGDDDGDGDGHDGDDDEDEGHAVIIPNTNDGGQG